MELIGFLLQALLIHGFQLLDMWITHVAVKNSDCQRSKFLDSMTAGLFFFFLVVLYIVFFMLNLECISMGHLKLETLTCLLDRLTVGMERPPQPKPRFLSGHGYFGNGARSLLAHLVAAWPFLSSSGCSFVSQHTRK